MQKYSFVFGLLFLFFSCGEKKCPYKPSPVFSKDLEHVLQYNYEVKGQESLESVFLDTKVLLELYQNVCEETLQEYKFTVKGDFATYPDSLWLKEASRQMVFLSSLSTAQRALKDWGDIIELRRPEMRLGEAREVQEGVFVKVDKVASKEEGVLTVTLSQAK